MRKIGIAVIGLCMAAAVQAAAPSDASLDELLTLTRVDSLLEGMQDSFDKMLDRSMREAMQDNKPTPAQQKIMDDTRRKLAAVMREEMAWGKMRPMYLSIYKETLTQEEVDGMLAFYKTPAGQALITKMPLILQKSMAYAQNEFAPRLMQRVRLITQEAAEKLQAAGGE